jgi:hypothetical protein
MLPTSVLRNIARRAFQPSRSTFQRHPPHAPSDADRHLPPLPHPAPPRVGQLVLVFLRGQLPERVCECHRPLPALPRGRRLRTILGQQRKFGEAAAHAHAAGQKSVWIAQGKALSDVEKELQDLLLPPRKQRALLGEACLLLTDAFLCTSRIPRCQANTTSVYPLNEEVPILPCNTLCTSYWDTCRATFELYRSNIIKEDFALSDIANCVPTTTPTPRPGTFLPPYDQPPDVVGGRPALNYLPNIRGLLGVLEFPVGPYNFTYADGSTIEMQCWNPPTTISTEIQVVVTCTDPFILNVEAQTCILPCPFPVFDPNQAMDIRAALIGPAIAGVILCVFVFLDALLVVLDSRNVRLNCCYSCVGRARAAMSSEHVSTVQSSGAGSASNAGHRQVKKQIRASTYYALLGGICGVTYFLVGPLPSLLFANDVSCGGQSLDFNQILAGTSPQDPAGCLAQRASPFVLQLMFNLILFAMVKIFMVIDDRAKKLEANAKRLIGAALYCYCVGLPVLCLSVTFSLDKLSTEGAVASIQLARQATLCQARVSQLAEIILIYLPFILTGILVTIVSIVILFKIKAVQDKVATLSTSGPGSPQKVKSAGDIALQQLMQRLAFLGLATFVVLIVLIASTSVFLSELTAYAPVCSLLVVDLPPCIFRLLSCTFPAKLPGSSATTALATKSKPTR